MGTASAPPAVDRFGVGKGLLATAALLAMFAGPVPHVTGVLIIAAVLLISRRLATRDILGLVDWHLLVLFAGLFVVTGALAATGLPATLLAAAPAAGIEPAGLPALVSLTLVGSNTIGNVPAVVLLLAVLKDLPAETLYQLAVLSTLAGQPARRRQPRQHHRCRAGPPLRRCAWLRRTRQVRGADDAAVPGRRLRLAGRPSGAGGMKPQPPPGLSR